MALRRVVATIFIEVSAGIVDPLSVSSMAEYGRAAKACARFRRAPLTGAAGIFWPREDIRVIGQRPGMHRREDLVATLLARHAERTRASRVQTEVVLWRKLEFGGQLSRHSHGTSR